MGLIELGFPFLCVPVWTSAEWNGSSNKKHDLNYLMRVKLIQSFKICVDITDHQPPPPWV